MPKQDAISQKKQIAVGLLAHVDAGKTTLTEALLYQSGVLKTLGRVDHKTSFLDTDAMERQRGITIFTKQAVLGWKDAQITLLDTPGHVDFSGEMERTLQVLDYAVLVISATDGVQGHTRTVWKLLERYSIPTLVFVNKMDLATADAPAVLNQLSGQLSAGCVEVASLEQRQEELALLDEQAMEEYLSGEQISPTCLARMFRERKFFPCVLGSALKLQGVEQLLDLLSQYMPNREYPEEFGASVYKIGRDAQGARLTYLKVTGGVLNVKDWVKGKEGKEPEKVDQIRLYSGEKFQLLQQAPAGTVCAVTGLEHSWAGQSLGAQADSPAALLSPVQRCVLRLPEGSDVYQVFRLLQPLQEEEPQLHLKWEERTQSISLEMMGEVQLDVLKQKIFQRFGLAVGFEPAHVLYKETIAAPVEGVGHFEPLRHYAEVHLWLEPGEQGSGLQFAMDCPREQLAENWQKLVLSHLGEKELTGVLTDSPLTDMKITLVAGRAHEKHTEGGDFRQATHRALRQGLMQAENLLLEPWYAFRMELPQSMVGRAMSDLQRMGGEFDQPQMQGEDRAVLVGQAPVQQLAGYGLVMAGYTKGTGQLSCTPCGYKPCQNPEQAIQQIGYDAQRDLDNPADSVFCSHGAGYPVPWQEVHGAAHIPVGSWRKKPAQQQAEWNPQPKRQRAAALDPLQEDEELAKLFAKTYGLPKDTGLFRPVKKEEVEYVYQPAAVEYLLVDGYNLLFAWPELQQLAQRDLEAARQALADILCNYQGFRRCHVILVYDAYKVKGNVGQVTRYNNIHIVYTKEAETADMYIEKATYQLADQRKVRVVTSDGAQQLIILGHGALRVSARAFMEELDQVHRQIQEILERNNR